MGVLFVDANAVSGKERKERTRQDGQGHWVMGKGKFASHYIIQNLALVEENSRAPPAPLHWLHSARINRDPWQPSVVSATVSCNH